MTYWIWKLTGTHWVFITEGTWEQCRAIATGLPHRTKITMTNVFPPRTHLA